MTPRPIRRAPEPRQPYMPPGVARVLASLKPWRHILKPGACEVLAICQWADLAALHDLQKIDDEVRRRLARPEHRKWLIEPFSAHARVGHSPGDEPRHGPASLQPLWKAPIGAEADVEGGPRP